MSKRRVTITVDAEFVDAASTAVAAGRAESVSAWINQAMAAQTAREQARAALADLIAGYEAEHGEITLDELADQAQEDRDAATALRAGRRRAG